MLLIRCDELLVSVIVFGIVFGIVRLGDALLESGLGSDDENKLVKTLFDGYNELIRPVSNMSEKVTVDVQLALHQLINVDEKNQILKSNVWLRMEWHDYQLTWEPAEHAGITVIRMKSEFVWKPDIVLFNNADGKYEVSFKPNVVIYDTGRVLWIPPAIYKSSCTIDVEYFPFDEQHCEMKFGSWTFNSEQVVLDWYEGQMKVDLEDYSPSDSWDILACPGQLSSQIKDRDHNISMITYTLTIRRKTLFYTVNLILPCVLITFLSFCVFFLPADAVEKMTMCISILLALVVFMVLVSKILPPTSVTIPLIAKYLLFTFIMNIFTILITVIIINWNFRTPRTHRMPRWVRSIFLNYLPRVIVMKRPKHSERWSKKSYSVRHDVKPAKRDAVGGGGGGGGGSSVPSSSAAFPQKHSKKEFGNGSSSFYTPLETSYCGGGFEGTASDVDFPLTGETYKAMEAIRFIAAHLKNEDDYSEILDDWRYVASVIDRLQLYIFVAITIGGTIGILINAPHIFEYVDQQKVMDTIKESKDGVGLKS